jgi:hypothetical protein
MISLFFFLSAISVKAEIFAGSSAFMTHISYITEKETQEIKENSIKRTIESVLKKYNSPMASYSDAFVKACMKYQIDCYLLPSIAGLESTFGRFIWPNSYNAFGWARGYMMFESWSQGIDTVAQGLRKNYMNKGALTVYEIGPIYSESPTWAIRVNNFIRQFEKEEAKMSLLSSQFPVQL